MGRRLASNTDKQVSKSLDDIVDVEVTVDALTNKQKRGLREIALILFSTVSVFLFVALYTYNANDPAWSHSTDSTITVNAGGKVGAWFADIAYFLFGHLAYLFPVIILLIGINLFRSKKHIGAPNQFHFLLVTLGYILSVSSAAGITAMKFHSAVTDLPANSGGLLGAQVSHVLIDIFNPLGATLFMLALLLTGLNLLGVSWLRIIDTTGMVLVAGWKKIQARSLARKIAKEETEKTKIEEQAKIEKERSIISIPDAPLAVKTEPVKDAPKIAKPNKKAAEKNIRAMKESQISLFRDHDNESGLPPLSLLDLPTPSKHKIAEEDLQAMARLLEVKLKEFNIIAKVTEVFPGPVITRYELLPAAGVKSSQVVNLAKDLARSLSVQSVRVVDVIPGKSVIGVEIPNEHRDMVRLLEIFQSKEYENAKSPLTIGLGKDIGGNPMVADLAKMPHLLVAGTTGSGKSVAVNAMILSLLYNATAEKIRMIMIDPKMLELSIYDGIPHLLTPVVTDMKDAASALRWCVAEMERRYKLMSALGVRNLAGYNRKVREAIDDGDPIRDPLHDVESTEPQADLAELPHIVIIVDELADMMMVVGKKVEELIARLAQKARASGMHLILATQRPSVDVLTGLIKANIPTRISFQVSSKIDSRTIIDQMGAEQLLGHGDMLHLSPGAGMPTRIHGAFVDDHEVHKVVEDIKSRGAPDYLEDILTGDQIEDIGMGASDSGPMSDDPEKDPLYDEAVAIVLDTKKASISGVQRRLKIGYNRAARLVEAMEAAGLVSQPQSNGLREVIAQNR